MDPIEIWGSAKEVHLVYQKSKDKERSRFIEELIWEEQKKSGSMAVVPVARPSFHVDVAAQTKTAAKTPQIIQFLKNHSYSASSINMYLRNPMEFYRNYVLGLREQEDLLDEPEARQVGTFLHGLLHECFKPFVNKKPKIDKAFRARCLELFEEKFDATFARSMKSDSFLLRAVIAERLNQFLDNEQNDESRQVKKILFLENRFEDVIALPAGKFKFSYVVDRIDLMEDGTIMIVDYKTGNTDLLPKSPELVAAMELSRETIKETVKSFQVPLYFHYLDKQFPKDPINAALYSLKTFELNKFLDPKKPLDRGRVNEVFLNALNFIMAEILNPDVPFEEDPDDSYA